MNFNPFPPAPTHNYRELPLEAPQPKIWKSLGHIAPGYEMQYGLETFSGDLDVDHEAELRYELLGMGQTLLHNGALVDGMVLAQQFGARHIIRFCCCTCGSGLWATRN